MEMGRTLKASVAVSALVHVVALGTLLLAGIPGQGTRQVFFVELKEARLVAAKPGGEPKKKAAPSAKPRPEPKAPAPEKAVPVREEKPEKIEQPAESKPAPSVEEKPAPHEEPALVQEPPASVEPAGDEAAHEGGEDASMVSEGVYAEAPGGDAQVLDAELESFALSSGPGFSRADLIGRIRRAIEAELTYPSLARRRKIEGTVVAGFSIDERGMPRDIEIVESSGFAVLDKEVVKIIRRASPYPYLPERVEVPVSFRLVEGR